MTQYRILDSISSLDQHAINCNLFYFICFFDICMNFPRTSRLLQAVYKLDKTTTITKHSKALIHQSAQRQSGAEARKH